jgi:hypothetical protein
MSEEHEFCCDIMKYVIDNYDSPFEIPIYIDGQTHDMKSDLLCIRLAKKTASGNLSRTGSRLVRFHYCPFCGAKLVDDDERRTDAIHNVAEE